MKKLFCCLLFFASHFSLSICFAQTRTIDSLYQVLRNEKEDTGKVNTLNALSEKLCEKAKYDSSMDYAQNALDLASKTGFEKGRGEAFYTMGVCYSRKDNSPLALNSLQEGLFSFRKIGNKPGISKCLTSIGTLYFYQGDYPKSLNYYFQALKIMQGERDKTITAPVLGYIGTIYHFQQKDSLALELYFKALDAYEKSGDKGNIIRTLSNIGYIYSELGKFDTALQCEFKALDISQKTGDRGAEAADLDNIGEIYADLGSYNKALENEFNSLSISNEIGNKRFYGSDLIDIGHVYTKQKKYALSKIYLDSALHVLKKIGDKEQIRTVYGYKIELDSAEGDYKAELLDVKYYGIFRDSLNSEKTVQEEMTHEFDRKADSINVIQARKDAIKESEIRNQKRIRNYTLVGLAIVVFFLVFVFIQRNRIAHEKHRSDELLLNILPEEVAEELKEKGSAKAKRFDEVTVLFTDFKGFTTISEKLEPEELVAEIDYCFKAFDNVIHKYNIEKIKTIGDSYMAVGGLPIPNKTHAGDVVNAAREIIQFMEAHKQERIKANKPVFEIRAGINSGPVVAGIVGVKKFAYDIWGDTVNLASRMESSGEPGKINISGSTYELVKNDFTCTYRGKIQAKNKGEVDMYFVS